MKNIREEFIKEYFAEAQVGLSLSQLNEMVDWWLYKMEEQEKDFQNSLDILYEKHRQEKLELLDWVEDCFKGKEDWTGEYIIDALTSLLEEKKKQL